MKDKLIIQNFSGIDYLEIELKKLNILIGEQASGKSTVAKLFYYFNDLFQDIRTCVYQELFNNSYEKIDFLTMQVGRFGRLFDNLFGNEKFKIEYFFSQNYSITLSYNEEDDKSLTIDYSNDLHHFIQETIQKYQHQVIATVLTNENTRFSFELMEQISRSIQQDFLDKGIHFKKQIFIPAGRSYFSTLHDNIFNFIDNEKSNIDYLLKQFGSFYQTAKKITQRHQLSNQNLFETVIKAKYSVDENGVFLTHQDGRKVNISHASSGQQEASPILLIIQHILDSKIKQDEGLILYIEEPEAHLFPTAQKDLVHLFARLFNHLQSDDCHIFITTHSPYLLSSFNTLLTAGSVVRQNPEKAQQVYQVIPENEVLFSEQVGAYSLMKGQLKSLIDSDEKLILADVLDEVSGIIADEFDKLLDLKYGE